VNGAIDAIQIAPDFKQPCLGDPLGAADGGVIVEVGDFQDGVGGSVGAQNANFIALHDSLGIFKDQEISSRLQNLSSEKIVR
jgi:hypothetical protein